MLLESARIENFKSIGKESNVLYVDSAVTALIGKNESGKSNVLEAIGRLNKLCSPLDANYLKLLTRGQEEKPTVSLRLSFSSADKELYPSADGYTTLVFTGTEVTLSGGLSELISQDEELSEAIAMLSTGLSSKELKLDSSQLTASNALKSKLSSISDKIYVSFVSELSGIRRMISPSNLVNKADLLGAIDRIEQKIKAYYDMIPQTYYRTSDETLKDSYSFDDIKKLMDSDNIFHNLMIAANVDKDTLFKAFQGPTEPAKKTYKVQVVNKLKELTEVFNKFYQQEEVFFDFDIEGQNAKLYVYNADKYMSFSERSNGLKWYFSLFIDAKAKTISNRPILYLLDEPGVYLHVNAQKQLVKLFRHLCESGNQVIYTTHSPYMIDGNDIFNVRAVEKDDNSLTKIFRSIHSYNLTKETRVETLTPLTQALGMDLKYNIGPQYEKLNLVVEGVTDCMYLTAMMKHLGITEENKPNIIPCVGVDAVHLMVSILIGWGCKYKVVLDYDSQGYNQFKKITQKSTLTDETNVFFVNCKSANSENDVKGVNKATTESLIAAEDNNKLTNKFDGTNDTKTMAAKEFMDKVLSGDITVTETTSNNFRQLFVVLGIME